MQIYLPILNHYIAEKMDVKDAQKDYFNKQMRLAKKSNKTLTKSTCDRKQFSWFFSFFFDLLF